MDDAKHRQVLDLITVFHSYDRRGMRVQAADTARRIAQAADELGYDFVAAGWWEMVDAQLAQVRPSGPANVSGLVD